MREGRSNGQPRSGTHSPYDHDLYRDLPDLVPMEGKCTPDREKAPDHFFDLSSPCQVRTHKRSAPCVEYPVHHRGYCQGCIKEWPGRMELLEVAGADLLLDGAHNPAGFEALLAALADLRGRLAGGRSR